MKLNVWPFNIKAKREESERKELQIHTDRLRKMEEAVKRVKANIKPAPTVARPKVAPPPIRPKKVEDKKVVEKVIEKDTSGFTVSDMLIAGMIGNIIGSEQPHDAPPPVIEGKGGEYNGAGASDSWSPDPEPSRMESYSSYDSSSSSCDSSSSSCGCGD
jgi:hypothetical protein